MKRRNLMSLAFLVGSAIESEAFASRLSTQLTIIRNVAFVGRSRIVVQVASQPATESFILTELRGAAMKLHTREQAPKEGQAGSTPRPTYTPTHSDYLSFLVDSQYVYKTMEEKINTRSELAAFRDTGLERFVPLEKDIEFMMTEYNLVRPDVGSSGLEYATKLKNIESIPEFMCHYYNFYFAHTAGGRMIGKQMSALLLNKKTLEFYKWDGDLNVIKDRVKAIIETMAATWNNDERKECVNATPAAFQGGGAINSYLSGGQTSH